MRDTLASWVLWGVLCAGCREAPQPPAERREVPHPSAEKAAASEAPGAGQGGAQGTAEGARDAAAAALTAHAASPSANLPQVRKVAGVDGPRAALERTQADERWQLPEGALVELHYPGGTSLRVHGPALFVTAPSGEEALLLYEGTVTVDRERTAPRPESGFWFATPSLRGELVQGARLALRALPSGETQLHMVSGRLTYLAAHHGEATPHTLSAGQVLRVAADGSEGTRAGAQATLEGAERALRALKGGRAPPHAPGAGGPLHDAVVAALELLSSHLAEERALRDAHRTLSAQGDPAAMGAQRSLAEHAGKLVRARRLLRARLAMLQAQVLGHEPAGESAALISRARASLAGTLPP